MSEVSVFIVVLCTLLCTGHTQDAVLTIEPNSFSFFIGESVTFICDMNEGEDTDWYYKITKDGQKFTPYSTHKDSTLQMTYTGDGGEYQCSGSWKRAYYTKNSNTVSITVLADQPKAQITSDMRDIPVGGSVTLTCSVNPSSSSGWKYCWYRDNTTVDVVSPSNGRISVSQEGLYRCRGGRGNPGYYTEDRQQVHVNTTGEFIFSSRNTKSDR
uniref:Ig-like domain-containing protein n=1 Tax=Oreochromis niloticus TaxID=8128 RepID=A0A669DMB3_ORENI